MASKPSTTKQKGQGVHIPGFPQNFIGAIADEVAKTVVDRLPHIMNPKKKTSGKKSKKLENAIFLDTSAIIDGRIFDVIALGFLADIFAIPQSILAELKHIADSQDMVKKERGRRGLELLEKLKKTKGVKFYVIPDEIVMEGKRKDVDEMLIRMAKSHKGRVITCDYNLEKKATIEGIRVVNVNALANVLKVTAVPGESLHIKVLHLGKEATQGVGYLDDGTMIVVEQGSTDIDKMVDVVISRVIQTTAGRILFAKKI